MFNCLNEIYYDISKKILCIQIIKYNKIYLYLIFKSPSLLIFFIVKKIIK